MIKHKCEEEQQQQQLWNELFLLFVGCRHAVIWSATTVICWWIWPILRNG